MRIFLGFLVAAVALAAAAYLHSDAKLASHRLVASRTASGVPYVAREGAPFPGDPCPPKTGFGDPYAAPCKAVHYHAHWQDALAIFIAVAGVGAGLGIVLRH